MPVETFEEPPEGGVEDVLLVTLPEAREFLQKDENEVEQDSILTSLIAGASDQIISHCGREFAPKGTETETRTFLYVGGRHLDLWPYDVREVSGVTLGSDLGATKVVLAAGDWRLRPVPAPEGVFQKLKLPALANYPTLTDDFEVEVTGLWGFEAVPERVKHWCKVTVAIWLRKDVSAFSRTLAMDEDRLEVPEGLPSAVVHGLRNFTRKPAILPR
jgi:hypothetical protein